VPLVLCIKKTRGTRVPVRVTKPYRGGKGASPAQQSRKDPSPKKEQKLHFFASDGSREAPLPYRPTTYWFDNCALSLLTTEAEWKASGSAQLFRKRLKAHDKRTLIAHTGPATLERYMFRTELSLSEIHRKKVIISEQLLGHEKVEHESLEQFQESVAFTLTRLLGLFFMVLRANEIFRETKGSSGFESAKLRIQKFAEWASDQPGTGAQTLVASAVYEALGLNEKARSSLGISSAENWESLMNGAWDLMHWDLALSMLPEQGLNPALFREPVAVFVTADNRLAQTFAMLQIDPEAKTILVRPACFPPDPSLVTFVQRQIRHTWPELASPMEYAEDCARLEHVLAQVEATSGGDRTVAGLRTRCAEIAQALQGRQTFALDLSSRAS
jgi:hypothetical protein